MFLPASAENRHLQHFAGAFVNTGDFNVALDFFNRELFGVAKTVFGGFVAGFGGVEFRNRAFGGEAVVVDFQLFGRPVNIRAGRFKTDIVRRDEL